MMQKTTFPFEIVIHDDASTDGTSGIILEYARQYPGIIRPYIQEENQYSIGNGYVGIEINKKRAKGKYVAFCEGDDYWIDPLKLQKQVDFLESHPDYSMCFHRAAVLDYLGNGCGLKCFDIEDREYSFDEIFNKWICPTASLLFRRECLDYPLVGKDRMVCGDLPLVLSCASMGKVRGMSDYMSVYRIQNGGVTYNSSASKGMIMKYPEYYEFLRDNFSNIERKSINRRIADFYYLRSTLHDKRDKKLEDIKKAIKTNPEILKYMVRTMFGLLYPKTKFHR